MKKCPYCAEEIQDDALKCRHCGELVVSQQWRDFASRYYFVPAKKQKEMFAGLSTEQQTEFRRIWEALLPQLQANPQLKVATSSTYKWSAWKLGCAGLAVLVLIGYLGAVLSDSTSGNSSSSPKKKSSRPGASRSPAATDPIPQPPQPSPRIHLEVRVTDCTSDEYGYTRIKGYVVNTGTVPVRFVEMETKWLDSTDQVVDTGMTYAVGAEHLRPGERSTFQDSIERSDVSRCQARVLDYQIAE